MTECRILLNTSLSIQFCNCLHVATWCNGIPIKVATYKWFYFIFIIIWHTSKEERVLHEFIWCRYHAVQVSVPSYTSIWYYLSVNSKHVPWHVGFIAKSSQYLFCTVDFSHERSSVTTSLFLYKKNQVFSKHWNDTKFLYINIVAADRCKMIQHL